MKNALIPIIAILVLVALFFGFNSYIYHQKQGNGDATSGLIHDVSGGVSFLYAPDFKTHYITPVDWPPTIRRIHGEFSCTEPANGGEPTGTTELRSIGGKDFCVTQTSEGAAGSVYIQYAYAWQLDTADTAVLTFSVREVQCANYDEPKKSECENERTQFSPDTMVVDIAGSASLDESYKNLSYSVGRETVQLVNGHAEKEAAPGSASKVVTQYFGNEVWGDLNGDGKDDVAFLITQDGGGSGIFFYLVGAINNGDGAYRGIEAMLIGDRIAPQTTEYRNGVVLVNYADRAPGEAMATVPHIGKTLYAKYDPASNSFGEVVQNFEGESASGAGPDTQAPAFEQ